MTFDHVSRWTWTGLLEVLYIQNIFFFFTNGTDRRQQKWKWVQKHETLKQDNLTEEDEEEEKMTSQINNPR